MDTYNNYDNLEIFVRKLCSLKAETECVEFKHNNIKPDEIGEYISALSNTAATIPQPFAYVGWGIDDASHKIIGTDNKNVVVLEIPAASHTPVSFKDTEYIRVGSYKKKLKGHPEQERALWSAFEKHCFEQETAAEITEQYQLPAPLFETTAEHTRVVLFAHRSFQEIERDARIRAAYLHASLKYVERKSMTNKTLRERFELDAKNSATVSRIIKDAIDRKLIKCQDETVGAKAKKYLPYWA